MAKHRPRGNNQLFIETKLGIVTRTGEWFHTSSEDIEKFVPGLLEEVSLEQLIREAQAWVRSANSLSMTLLLGLLFLVNPWMAGLSAIAFHWLWYYYKSALVNRWIGSLLRWMNTDSYQFIIALLALSLFGMWGQYAALGIGTLFFFVFRLGLLDKIWKKLTADKEMTLNDRVLKMVLVKHAMAENLAPRDVREMEEKIIDLASQRKGK